MTPEQKKNKLAYPTVKLICHFISCITQKHCLHGIFKSKNRLKISAVKPWY